MKKNWYTEPLKPSPDAQHTIESALKLAKAVLRARGVCLRHKREVLRIVLWKLSCARYPKYRQRFRSRAAQTAIDKLKTDGLRHEHVYPCAAVISRVLSFPTDRALVYMNRHATGCVVTKEQALTLDRQDREKPLHGWARYREAEFPLVKVQSDGAVLEFTP